MAEKGEIGRRASEILKRQFVAEDADRLLPLNVRLSSVFSVAVRFAI